MSGFQDRTGCPNEIRVPKKIREQFGDCFERMGGVEGLYEWAQENLKSFYTLYAKMAEKHIKTEDTNKTHEQFIEMIRIEQEQRRIESGKPVMVLDAPAKVAEKS